VTPVLEKPYISVSINPENFNNICTQFQCWTRRKKHTFSYKTFLLCQLRQLACRHYIYPFILKNMGAAIIDFGVCPPLVKTTKSHNVQNANTRGRSSSRKRPLSGSDEQMKPPSSRQRSQLVTTFLLCQLRQLAGRH
jgi:hypothetical protein